MFRKLKKNLVPVVAILLFCGMTTAALANVSYDGEGWAQGEIDNITYNFFEDWHGVWNTTTNVFYGYWWDSYSHTGTFTGSVSRVGMDYFFSGTWNVDGISDPDPVGYIWSDFFSPDTCWGDFNAYFLVGGNPGDSLGYWYSTSSSP